MYYDHLVIEQKQEHINAAFGPYMLLTESIEVSKHLVCCMC